MLDEIKRLLNDYLKEVKNDDKPINLKEQHINEGIIEGIEYSIKTIDVVANQNIEIPIFKGTLKQLNEL
mgnify:FL=1|tara:strand:+ start:367 stop:573 length:207 start_codon:yes stop_codon:yes gene_type:complete